MIHKIYNIALTIPILLISFTLHAQQLKVFNEHRQSQSYLMKELNADKCLLSNLASADHADLLDRKIVLEPGVYRFHLPMAMSPLDNIITNSITVTVSAGNEHRDFTSMDFKAADEFADLTLDLVLTEKQEITIKISWGVKAESIKEENELQGKRALAIQKSGAYNASSTKKMAMGLDMKDDNDEILDDLDLTSDTEISRSRTKTTPFRLLYQMPFLEYLSPFVITFDVDKVAYYPGEKGKLSLVIENISNKPQKADLKVVLCSSLDNKQELISKAIDLAGKKTIDLSENFDTTGLYWGVEANVSVVQKGLSPVESRKFFTVRKNFVETAIGSGRGPHGTLEFKDLKKAEEFAEDMKQRGINYLEIFFWGPCDMFDFTPDTEIFFGGQRGYVNSVQGMKNLINECHKRGIATIFYANLWGGSSVPAFEMMRLHPEWFGNGNYRGYELEYWDLLAGGDNNGQIPAPGNPWAYNQIHYKTPDAVFERHAKEIIASCKMFGWDGIRYDSAYSQYWTTRAWNTIRKIVEKEYPDFQFGYNSFANNDYGALALDVMVGNGGFVLAEALRLGAPWERWCKAVCSWRRYVYDYGGNGVAMMSATSAKEKVSPLAAEYIHCIYLATGSLPSFYKTKSEEEKNYFDFANRYPEFIKNRHIRPLRNADKVVTFGRKVEFLNWQQVAGVMDTGKNKHRLILNLLNIPGDKNYMDPNKTMNPPVRQLPVTVTLPANTTVDDVYLLKANPTPHHQKLAFKQQGENVTFTLDNIRFYGCVVLDYDGKKGLESVQSLKELSDSYITDWQVIGPFPSDPEFSGFDSGYEPEKEQDFTKSYEPRKGHVVKWQKVHVDPKTSPTGNLAVDFLDIFNITPEYNSFCVYAYTEVEADHEMDAIMYTKSDDAIKVWVNGKEVMGVKKERSFQKQSEDKTNIKLTKGTNKILVKVCNRWLYCQFVLRLADHDNRPLMKGVKYWHEK